MKAVAPNTPPSPFGTLTAELANEARRHLAFSCYCSACESVSQKHWPAPAAAPSPSGK